MNKRKSETTDEWIDRWKNQQMSLSTDGWIDRWNESTDEWIDRWMNQQMSGTTKYSGLQTTAALATRNDEGAHQVTVLNWLCNSGAPPPNLHTVCGENCKTPCGCEHDRIDHITALIKGKALGRRQRWMRPTVLVTQRLVAKPCAWVGWICNWLPIASSGNIIRKPILSARERRGLDYIWFLQTATSSRLWQ